jgi:tetratricopeptide (TPR) repeat protein
VSLARLTDGQGSRRIYSETLYPRLQLGWSDLASLTDDRFSYIEAPRPELYDLASDPQQKENLAAGVTSEARSAKEVPPALRSMRADLLGMRKATATPERASSSELEKLGSLGYIRVDAGSAQAGGLPDPKDRIEELRRYKKLFEAFYARRDQEAIGLARAMLAENPRILSVWRILATSLERTGRLEEAATALSTALARPDLTGSAEDIEQTIGELSAAAARTKDSAAAERTLAGLVARGATAESVRRELARLLHRRGRVAEALALLPDAAGSRDAATLDVYGSLLADSGRLREAGDAFRRALESKPEDATVLLHLGMLSLREKNPAAARAWFTKSLASDPTAPGTLAALGLAQVQLGDPHGALESWDRALVLDPTQFDTLFNRAVLAGRTGDAAGARRGLERFIATAPAEKYGPRIAEARKLLRALPAGRS